MTTIECPHCGEEIEHGLARNVVADPNARGTTGREQYSCYKCGEYIDGGRFA